MAEKTPSSASQIFVIGANHLTASVDLRDRLLFNEATLFDFVAKLSSSETVKEIVVLSTCNRSEIYAVAENAENARDRILDLWSEVKGLPAGEINQHSYFFLQGEAMRHLFRVMGSLDSLVLGETQILGQAKEAYQLALKKGWTDFLLNRLFQAGMHVGKRVHSETGIHEGAVSISYAAVMLAKKVLGDLKGKTVGIVGTGEMGNLAAQHLHKAGAAKFVFFNRSISGAEKLAADFGGEICLLSEIDKRLPQCDIVISATGAPDMVITKQHAETAMGKRGGYPIFLIDIAAPRDIDPACGEIDGVFLFSIDDLLGIVKENQDLRQLAAEKAQAIVEEEARKAENWAQSLDIVPVIKGLRERCMATTEIEIEKWAAGQSPEVRKLLEGLGRGLMNKFLHGPSIRLKLLGERGDAQRASYYASLLFALTDEEEKP